MAVAAARSRLDNELVLVTVASAHCGLDKMLLPVAAAAARGGREAVVSSWFFGGRATALKERTT